MLLLMFKYMFSFVCLCLYIFFVGKVYVIFFFFFFQAEDGIRDTSVTGVQTCALPISGHETITYRSGADATLHSIYLHAYPNAFRDHRTLYAREGERWGEDYVVRLASREERGWMTIDSVTADGASARLFLDETVARVDLPRPLARGASVTLRLAFQVQVPKPMARLGHVGSNYSMR